MEGDMHDVMHLQWAWSEVNSGGIGSDVMHGGKCIQQGCGLAWNNGLIELIIKTVHSFLMRIMTMMRKVWHIM